MLYLLLGTGVLAASGFLLWSARPADGRMRDWITPRVEPYVAIRILMGATTGLFLLGSGVAAIGR